MLLTQYQFPGNGKHLVFSFFVGQIWLTHMIIQVHWIIINRLSSTHVIPRDPIMFLQHCHTWSPSPYSVWALSPQLSDTQYQNSLNTQWQQQLDIPRGEDSSTGISLWTSAIILWCNKMMLSCNIGVLLGLFTLFDSRTSCFLFPYLFLIAFFFLTSAISSSQLYLLVSLYLSLTALATPSSNLLFLIKHIGKTIYALSDDNI